MPDSGTQQLVVKSPAEEHRCYDVLGIHPSASLEDVKRAFKRRALKAHPDKEGGSQEAFMCLNKAYELLCDATQRAVYDFELQQLGSQDGQNFTSGKNTNEGQNASPEESQPESGDPEMLCESFMNMPEGTWPALLEILSNENLFVLIRYLQSKGDDDTKENQPKAPDENKNKSKHTVPGLTRVGSRYQGQVVWQGNRVKSFTTQLDAALEARMGLESLRQAVIKRTSEGSSFDAAIRDAVTQLREKDQNSCFYLQFSFDSREASTRLATPIVADEDKFLEYRNTLLNLREKGASDDAKRKAHGNMIAEVKQVKIRRAANKRISMADLLEEARAELRKRGKELPPEGTVASRLAKIRARAPPVSTVTQFKVIGPRKVGVLPRPDPSLTATSYMEPRSIFDVSMVHITNGVKFFQLSDGSGWLPQCSRKEPSRIVVEQADGEFDRAAILDADDASSDKSDKSSDSSDSSSSSSSSS